jgi:hypothetical protein
MIRVDRARRPDRRSADAGQGIRHDHEGVAPGHDGFDRLTLAREQGLEAEQSPSGRFDLLAG